MKFRNPHWNSEIHVEIQKSTLKSRNPHWNPEIHVEIQNSTKAHQKSGNSYEIQRILKSRTLKQAMLDPSDEYTKTLGIEWNVFLDHFRLTATKLSPLACITKWTLLTDIAMTYDIFGMSSPTVTKRNQAVHKSSLFLLLHPILESSGVVHIGARKHNS